METLFSTEVTPDQIDHLGHMNVRFYGAHARAGADHLLAQFGLVPDDRLVVIQRDSYTRHHREQLVGAPLEVRGGVLDASPERVRLYEELLNADTDEVAATFVLAFDAAARTTRDRLALDAAVVDAAAATTISVPDHGRPRSVSLDEDPTAAPPPLDVLRGHDLAMRQVRTIGEAECDDDGFVRALPVAELVWGGAPLEGREFRPLEELADGVQMGFATMETRASWATLPRIGDRIQAYGAEVDIQNKTMRGRYWVYDVDDDHIVAVFTVVNVAFDTAARRSMVIPEEVRRRLGSRYHPELDGPTPPSS